MKGASFLEAHSFLCFIPSYSLFILISSDTSGDFLIIYYPSFDPIKLLAAMISRDRKVQRLIVSCILKLFPFSILIVFIFK